MCDQTFPDKELIQSDDHFYCPIHAKFHRDNSWIELFSATATNEEHSNALLVQDKKDELKANNINSIIETSYSQSDNGIQSTFTLLVPSQDYNQAKLFLTTHN